MFDDTYAKIPRDEFEARALKELMGLNIELPKVRLLAILREEGGDPDCAAARAFIEMRNQYKEARGEEVSVNDDDCNEDEQDASHQQSYNNNNDDNEYSNSGGYYYQESDNKNYCNPTYNNDYEVQHSNNNNINTLNPLANDDDDGYYGNYNNFDDHHHENGTAGIGPKMKLDDGQSFDMTFDATVDDDQRKPSDPDDGQYMLRVRSKDFGKNDRNQFNNWPEDNVDDYCHHRNSNNLNNDDDDGMMRARSAGDNYYGHREQERSSEHDHNENEQNDDDNDSSSSSPRKKFPGVFMKTFAHGGCAANKFSYSAADGSYVKPYSFLNEGIRIIRLDTDSARNQNVNLVDTSSLEDDEFESLCDEWLDERYDATEIPDMFHEGQDYQTAKAKSAHDLELFSLYTKFEQELRKGWSLEGCLSTFMTDNSVAARNFRIAMGLPSEEDLDHLKKTGGAGAAATTKIPTMAAAPAKVKTTGTSRNPNIGTHKHAGDVTRNVANVSRTFSVNVRLPRTCAVTRVEVLRNTYLERRFDRYCETLKRQGVASNIGTGYHGTRAAIVDLIAETGFICPLEQKVTHKSGNDGFYGNGNYQSPDPNVAFWYSQGNKMLVTKCARGRVYRCPGMMMGAPLQSGYDTHESPDGVEWVFYNSAAVLPVAIIHFNMNSGPSASVTTLTKATIRGRAVADFREKLDEKAHGGVHLSNKDRKALNRARNAQIQTKKPKKK